MSMPNSLDFATVDVFTRTRFKGNQLAIVKLPAEAEGLNQQTKQAIAREFNFSETVFLHAPRPDSQERRLDIFTSTQELPFAGHPIIGSLVHVAQSTSPPLENVKFVLKAGPLVGRYNRRTLQAEAEVPHKVHIHEAKARRSDFLDRQPIDRLPQDPKYSHFPFVSIVKGMTFALIEVPELANLSALDPSAQIDPDSVLSLDEGWEPSLTASYYYTLTGTLQTETTIRSRMFSPRIEEDACTGSAACTLASYLSLLRSEADKTYAYVIEQGVEMGRTGEIHVTVTLDSSGKSVEKVVLAGSAVDVTSGCLMLP
ncbi:uncharacterized protein KY384_005966 [Bacidia gigantensis]|uniref:uncharacterized protein n=1 Tax=Bacidia gigantensis TaxID=2732470 RepID=UPI001D03AE6A|nr:uncharacterized protein KY384_005966 [Bacidia gigantensis]KAG8529330.1 hypothetical protein KY384_005966 [Bacidia gigantensis]